MLLKLPKTLRSFFYMLHIMKIQLKELRFVIVKTHTEAKINQLLQVFIIFTISFTIKIQYSNIIQYSCVNNSIETK